MKKMLYVAVAAAGMAFVPAQASEVGLLVDKQIGVSRSIPGSDGTDAVSPTGFGIRGAYTVLDLKVAELGLSGTYHPESSEDVKLGGEKVGKFKEQYFAVGVQADWKFLVNLHAALEMRRETLKGEISVPGLAYVPGSTNVTRPWASVGIGFSIPTPIVSPFVRLEAAYALKTYDDVPKLDASTDEYNKSLASKYQIAIYGGIRF